MSCCVIKVKVNVDSVSCNDIVIYTSAKRCSIASCRSTIILTEIQKMLEIKAKTFSQQRALKAGYHSVGKCEYRRRGTTKELRF